MCAFKCLRWKQIFASSYIFLTSSFELDILLSLLMLLFLFCWFHSASLSDNNLTLAKKWAEQEEEERRRRRIKVFYLLDVPRLHLIFFCSVVVGASFFSYIYSRQILMVEEILLVYCSLRLWAFCFVYLWDFPRENGALVRDLAQFDEIILWIAHKNRLLFWFSQQLLCSHHIVQLKRNIIHH